MDCDPTSDNSTQWADMIDRIRDGSAVAVEDLYTIVGDGARPRLRRQVGVEHAEDRLHEVVLLVLKAIHRGDLREPKRFVGFVRTITQRRVFAHIRDAVHSRRFLVPLDFTEPVVARDQSPEALALAHERAHAGQALLARLIPRDREILVRFYYHEQDWQQICGEMGLTRTQFRLFKSRAIARCSNLARRRPRNWQVS